MWCPTYGQLQLQLLGQKGWGERGKGNHRSVSRSENALRCNKKTASPHAPGAHLSLDAGCISRSLGRGTAVEGDEGGQRRQREQVRAAATTSCVQGQWGGLSARLPGPRGRHGCHCQQPESGRAQGLRWAFHQMESLLFRRGAGASGSGAWGGAALRRGVQAQHPVPPQPKGYFHRVQRNSGPCSLCWGARLRLDQTASCAREAWSPGHLSPGCRLPARPPTQGRRGRLPKGNSGGPSRGRTPCGHS